MNAMIGDAGDVSTSGINVNNPRYVQFFRISSIPAAASIFVFLDEHPDSINDGYFLNEAYDWKWNDLPASYHNGAASLWFADGHSETHRWLYASTKRPAQPDGAAPLPMQEQLPVSEWADFGWLTQRMSVKQ
jgi:prepilin-type processing-associated H-X9-DG protein